MSSTTVCSPVIPFSLAANSSSAALPLVPRRPHSAPTSRRVSPAASPAPTMTSLPLSTPASRAGLQPFTPIRPAMPVASTSATQLVVEPPTPAAPRSRTPSPVNSSSDSPAHSSRPRRVRGQRFLGMRPPERSTPIPDTDSDSDSETPRRLGSHLRIDVDAAAAHGHGPRHLSESHVHTLARNQCVRSPPATADDVRLIRKKSGEPLKSSLKGRWHASTSSNGDHLTITTTTAASKSEPATPTLAKNVHFDAQLEHVKLFLAEQKPLAVSRDGSPTATDTSGTESEFPSFIYGSGSAKGALVMRKVGVPPWTGLGAARDVGLEALEFDAGAGALSGIVRVRNLAFEKWVAVRFTTDGWQTTSEVTARYVDAVEGGTQDRFAFVVKLNEARLEDKTLFLAVRYVVSGREIWDNNGGRNYEVAFAREPKDEPRAEAESGGEEVAELKSRLEEIVKVRASGSPRKSPPVLGGRYDFAAALRHSWSPLSASPTPTQSGQHHSRMATYPATRATHNSIPWPQKCASPMASPMSSRSSSSTAFDDSAFRPPPAAYVPDSDTESSDLAAPVPAPAPALRRRHTRGGPGYFDAPAVRRTPPTSPFDESFPAVHSAPPPLPAPAFAPRAQSFPPSRASPPKERVPAWGVRRGGSEESTPSITSLSSASSSEAASPALSAVELDAPRDSPLHHLSDYHELLSRFCFYTGDDVPRAHSASSIEEMLSSPAQVFTDAPGYFAASGSAASDLRSGSTTPTAPHHAAFPSTPTLCA